MGLCPSRKVKECCAQPVAAAPPKPAKGVYEKEKEPERGPINRAVYGRTGSQPYQTTKTQLRTDAEVFMPIQKVYESEGKADWEKFLEAKQAQLSDKACGRPFVRQMDGSFTAEYRKLLEGGAEDLLPDRRGGKGKGKGKGRGKGKKDDPESSKEDLDDQLDVFFGKAVPERKKVDKVDKKKEGNLDDQLDSYFGKEKSKESKEAGSDKKEKSKEDLDSQLDGYSDKDKEEKAAEKPEEKTPVGDAEKTAA